MPDLRVSRVQRPQRSDDVYRRGSKHRQPADAHRERESTSRTSLVTRAPLANTHDALAARLPVLAVQGSPGRRNLMARRVGEGRGEVFAGLEP